MRGLGARGVLLLLVLVMVLLLAFTMYQTPTMQFLLDGFRLCG